jgi:hypothetical protein
MREYHLRLGQLMHAFTNAELRLGSFMAVMLKRSLKPNPAPDIDSAFLLTGSYVGMRASALIDALKRLLRNIRAPEKQQKDVAAVLSHLAHIQFLRDKLAHRYVFPNGQKVVIESIQAAKEISKAIGISTDISALIDATHDLLLIPLKLHFLLYTEQNAEGRMKELVDAPWRYKPIVQGHPGQ